VIVYFIDMLTPTTVILYSPPKPLGTGESEWIQPQCLIPIHNRGDFGHSPGDTRDAPRDIQQRFALDSKWFAENGPVFVAPAPG
jgi:hypothetical protein